MSNQYLKAEEEGREKPKGANQFTTGKREKLDDAVRDRMRAERAAEKLERLMDSDKASTSEQIAAAKALIPFGKATLQSQEIKQAEPWQDKSEEELLEQVRALISSRPELLAGVKHLVEPPKEVGSVAESVVGEQQKVA
jgi:hypothetical protein